IHAGQTLNGTVNVTLNGWNTETNTVIVWVNFNENSDDDFEDVGERFLFTIKHSNYVEGNKVVNVPISIPIPNSATSGLSRIRIGFRTGTNTNFTSCDYIWASGEVEDYKINIIPKEEETEYFETLPPSSAALYLNGINDYVSGQSFIKGQTEVT